jgi:hypothetical protein
VLESIRAVRNRGAACINVRPQVQARFNERLQQAFRGTVWSSGCTSWYRQADGTNFSLWPWATWRYWLQTRRVDAASYDFIRPDQPTA